MPQEVKNPQTGEALKTDLIINLGFSPEKVVFHRTDLNFSEMTAEQLSGLSHERINTFSEYDYQQYRKRSVETGNKYAFGGVTTYDYSDIFYSCDDAALRMDDDGEWRVWQGGMLPTFKIRPVMLSKGVFETRMKDLGVQEDTLNGFSPLSQITIIFNSPSLNSFQNS